jgi:hypothetical protein
MSLNDKQIAYIKQVYPAAKMVQEKTGIPADLVVSWWTWETAFGENMSSRMGNNHAGIKANSTGAQGAVGQYAKYNSIDDFANDYARILSMPHYGYPGVLAAARNNPQNYTQITDALNKSQYAESDYNINTIGQRAFFIRGIVKGSTEVGAINTVPDVSMLSNDDMKKYAAVGLLFASAMMILKK